MFYYMRILLTHLSPSWRLDVKYPTPFKGSYETHQGLVELSKTIQHNGITRVWVEVDV